MSPAQPPDIEIAQAARLRPIEEIAAQVGLGGDELEPYGRTKAKVTQAAMAARQDAPDGDLVLVTAITPTPAGEGKTTTTIGLTQALQRLGRRAISATREPSLGPVFGVKGGAAGGGYAQVVPMEDINLHFTGDFAAVSAAHNLLAAMLDNHLHQGNALDIDARRVLWRRVMDMNDRALHDIVIGLGGRTRGVPRETGFDITPASEVMAILCLARDLEDLKARFGRIAVADRGRGAYVTAAELEAQGAMAVVMRDAVLPNLVQNLEGGPALIHGDMWRTNIITSGGRVVGIIDPALYYAHNEMELAYMALFDGVGAEFFDAYGAALPIDAEFFSVRRHIYNLYPLLVHLIIFGRKYLPHLDETLNRVGA